MKVAERLRGQIASGVHLHTLHEGDRLPSIRELARDWRVDPRAIRAGYRSLECDGLVTMKARSGVYVAAAGAGAAYAVPWHEEWIVDVLRRSSERGIAPADLWEHVQKRVRSVQLRTACLECNDDQTAWLVHETARDYGLDSFAVDLAHASAGAIQAELLSADLLVGTTLHAAELRRLAAASGKPLVLIRLEPGFVNTIVACLARGPLYFVVSDERFAEKLPGIYAGAPGCEMLRPVIAEKNRRPSIPRGAEVLVTRAARVKLGTAAIPTTVKRPSRMFCRASVAALVRVIVAANLRALNDPRAVARPFA